MSMLKSFKRISYEPRHFAQEFQGYYTEMIFTSIESSYNEVIISDNNFGTNLAIAVHFNDISNKIHMNDQSWRKWNQILAAKSMYTICSS